MSDQSPQHPPHEAGPPSMGGPAYPAQPPSQGQPAYLGQGQPQAGPPYQPNYPAQAAPRGQALPSRPDEPLHPLLPGGAFGQPGRPPGGGLAAHQLPHAASSGPQDGSRGAMWFAILTFAIVVFCLIAAALVQLGS